MARSFVPESIKKYISSFMAIVLTIAFLIVGFNHLDLTDTTFLTRVEFLWMDYKFRMRGEQPSGDEVALIAMDGKTLDRFGSGRLFQRDIMANVVDRLTDLKPKVIGFDITYQDPDPTDPEN